MQFYRFFASFDQIFYRAEYAHIVSLECVTPNYQLCQLVRDYTSLYGSLPSLEQLVMYNYVPCLDECDYGLNIDEAVPVLIHGIKTYGIFLSCKFMYLFHIHRAFEGVYPRLEDLLLQVFEQDEDQPVSAFQNQLNQSMSHQVDEFWKTQSSGLKKDHFPSRVLSETHSENCAICQEKMEKGQPVITLPCMHTFHASQDGCSGIEEWYTKINSCPLCKTTF
jgi:hypothetical protein